MQLSIVIPVYKAEDCLDQLYLRLKNTLEEMNLSFEIILVEDVGGDKSWDIIQQLASTDNRVKGIQLSRNFGQHYCITAGLDYCQGEWVIVMDCDLQDRPEEIPRLYQMAQQGYDVVLARRSKRKDSWLKRLSSRMYNVIFRFFTNMDYDSEVGNFRIISKKVVANYRLFHEQLRSFGGIIQWLGFTTASIIVQHDPRFAGKSSYSFNKLVKLALETIIAYSDKPLRLAVGFGFFMTSLAFLIGVFISIHAISHGLRIIGWSSLMVSIYFLGGIIITILGIIGIYLGKCFDEAKKRPLYIIAKSTDNVS